MELQQIRILTFTSGPMLMVPLFPTIKVDCLDLEIVWICPVAGGTGKLSLA